MNRVIFYLKPKPEVTSELFNAGMSRIAQKVGEENVEVILAALDPNKEAFCNEVADLLFHLLVLLRAKKVCLSDIAHVLKNRE